MSNKPRVYGFCAAGCKWEVVHKGDVATTQVVTQAEYQELKESGELVPNRLYVMGDAPVLTEATKLPSAGFYYIHIKHPSGPRAWGGLIYWDGASRTMCCSETSVDASSCMTEEFGITITGEMYAHRYIYPDHVDVDVTSQYKYYYTEM